MKTLEKYQNKFYQMIRTNDFSIDDEIKSEHTDNKFVELEDATIWCSPNDFIKFHIDNYQVWMEPYCGCLEGVGDGSYHIGFFANAKVVIDKELTKDAAKDIYKYALQRLTEIEACVKSEHELSEEDEWFVRTIDDMCNCFQKKTTELFNYIED